MSHSNTATLLTPPLTTQTLTPLTPPLHFIISHLPMFPAPQPLRSRTTSKNWLSHAYPHLWCHQPHFQSPLTTPSPPHTTNPPPSSCCVTPLLTLWLTPPQSHLDFPVPQLSFHLPAPPTLLGWPLTPYPRALLPTYWLAITMSPH